MVDIPVTDWSSECRREITVLANLGLQEQGKTYSDAQEKRIFTDEHEQRKENQVLDSRSQEVAGGNKQETLTYLAIALEVVLTSCAQRIAIR